MASKAAKYTSCVSDIKDLTYRVKEFTLKNISPSELIFEPGQFITLYVDEKTLRTYSISSNSNESGFLKLTIALVPNGAGSEYVKNLMIGDTVKFIGPSGLLRIKRPLPENIYFFASGTGIAPFIPMIEKLVDENYAGSINFYFGVRDIHDLFYDDKLVEFKSKLKNFRFKIYFSENKPVNEECKYEHDCGFLNLEAEKCMDKNAHYYLCGHPMMTEGVEKILLKNDVSAENIISEKF